MPSLILVADDSVTIQRVVEMTLAREDTRVISARSVDEALTAARRERPDLVLADVAMPGGKGGYDLASAMRADGALRAVPVVILASNFNPYDEARGRAAGVNGHVSKPFETQALIDRVKEILGSAAQPQAAPAPPRPSATVRPPAPPAAAVSRPAPAPAPAAPPARPASVVGAPLPAGAAAASASLPQPPLGLERPPVAGTRPPPPAPSLPPIPAGPLGRPPMIGGTTLRGAGGPVLSSAAQAAAAARATQPHSKTMLGVQAQGFPSARVATPLGSSAASASMPAAVPVSSGKTMPPASSLATARAAAAERAADKMAQLASSNPEYAAIAHLSREIIEQIAWEVVPELAETIIRSELERLMRDKNQ